MAVKTGKVTVSLPKDDLRIIAEYENKLCLPRSVLFKQAIELWLLVKKQEEIREKYAAVYSDPSVKRKQVERVEEMLLVALESWPAC